MADDKKLTPQERVLAENRKKAKEELKQLLEGILEKTPEELREDEKSILRARESYLSGDAKKKFSDVLNPVEKKIKKSRPNPI